jgi:hypothetical protein
MRLAVQSSFATTYSTDHFGANILSTRDRLGEDGTYDDAIDYLGVGTIRYPGGSLTERYFDITDPDQLMTQHYLTGADQPLLPYSEFMAFAEETGRSVLVVLPTRTQLGQQTDANGDRFAAIDEEALRDFVRDTLDGFHGSPVIAGFEIGNEYWDSGEMTSVEYGRVASAMARIVDEELTSHPDFESRFSQTMIHVQMGMENGFAGLSERYEGTAQEQLAQAAQDFNLVLDDSLIYSSGQVAWAKVANLLVIREFDLPEERDAVDGIVAHVYSRGEDVPSSHSFELRTLTKTWGEDFPDARPIVTEWNVRAPERDAETEFGLVQAGEMLDLVQAFGLYEVSGAYVWAVQQGSESNLAGDEGDPAEKVGGAFFRMMSQELPGTRAIVLDGADRRESELVLENAEAHVFAGGEKMVLYLQSTNTEDTHETTLDLSGLITGFDAIRMTKLGVEAGDAPGSSSAQPVLTELDPQEHHDNGFLTVTLAPREIVQITMEGADFTPALADVLARADLAEFGTTSDMAAFSSAESDFLFTDGPTLEDIGRQQEEAELARQVETDEEEDSDTGFMADMLMLGLLLPLAMVAGAF